MYGTSESDPVVRYYDTAFAAGATTDLAWFTREAQALGSPVLDLCCGTGRIAIELARKGLQVTALDASAGMLGILRGKLEREPDEVRTRIDIQEQMMESFQLDKKFRTAICCDSFFHNLSPEAERSCLEIVNRHLYSDGLLLFNIHNNPNPEFLWWASSAEAARPRKRGEYPLPGGTDTLKVYESLSHDPLNQRVETTLHFKRVGPGGRILEETHSAWSSRYLCRFEAMYLMELCGFQVDAVFGGYENEPVSVSGQLVIRGRKTKEAF